MKRGARATLLLGALWALGNARADVDSAGRAKGPGNRVYIVRMAEDPVVAYAGGIPGLAATAPGRGQKVDPNHPAVAKYAAHLDGRHSDALGRAGGGRKVYDYRFSFNGFAAELSAAQAEALRGVPGVTSVVKDEMVEADTSSTPAFLGLTDPGGLWDMLGGVGRAGEDVIIGIVDSGIWPEHPSFGDRTGWNGNQTQGGKLDYHQIPGWHGRCVPGEAFTASNCSQKLIGAQYFNAAWGGNAGIQAQRPWEFTSPRDYNGHGSHTASTAGGNHGIATTGAAAVFGPISGMAPRARVAAYKALWSTQDAATASGYTSDLVAAIDQAVADGVDVINYSISGTQTNFLDPVQVSFLYAANAGVFVACSAGNAGPTTGTVAHPGPWLTTVAAGTHNRSGEGSVTLGNGATYHGASVATAVGPAPLVDSTAAGLPGANATMVALCYAAADNGGTPVLDPAKVAGKIVVCDRGVTARVAKSLAVLEAGGVGMILLNTSPNSINADFHYVPTVHLADTDRTAVKAYAAAAGATAAIAQATIVYNVPAPLTASFSSRGPLAAGGGDLLKPDVIAPGQDILAAVAPPGNGGLLFNLYSGTSMSSPHVAGLAALLRNLHPDWTPMMIKSALMTSATDVLDGPNTNPLVIFRQGAGHVRPNSAAAPGLVLSAGWNDWLAFLCGTTTGVGAATCSALVGQGYSLDPSDLNVASIAIGDLIVEQTVTRRLTNVGPATATYTASFSGMAGFDVAISPASLTLAPGETKAFTVKFTRAAATLGSYAGAQLTWSDGVHQVRIPVAVRPLALVAPAQVSGTGGPLSYPIKFGYTGAFTATARGLVPAATFAGTVADDPGDSFAPGGPGTVFFDVAVPAGTTYARFSLFDANVSPASDLDLYVYRGSTLVGSSGGPTAAEQVNLLNPAADTYRVWVHGYNVPGTASFTLFTWVLGSAAAGNMTVSAPASAVAGASGTIDLTFTGLAPATKYLGSVAYGGTTGLPNPTIVRIDTP
ncbi:MAG TPA: S8 family peptidase [Anaeromyxobacteraceae bacterium]|nr:S8 family peptidase [Anaeromyxobacteraceae bacterium]